MDAADRIAKEAMVNLARDFAFEFDRNVRDKARPLLAVLAILRPRAVEALGELTRVNPTDPNAVRSLQNEVNKYLDLLKTSREIVDAGLDARSELELDDAEAEAVREDIERDDHEDE